MNTLESRPGERVRGVRLTEDDLIVEVTRGDANPCAKMRYIVACADLSESPKKRDLPADLKGALSRHLK